MAIAGNGKTAICAVSAALLALLLGASPARAGQQPATSSSNDTAAAQASGASAQGAKPAVPQEQTKRNDRIFGVMPNYGTVEGGDHNLPPLTVGQKFKLAAQGTFDPYEFAIVGFVAGINQVVDKDSYYGQGALGYWKRYGAGFADQTIGNLMTGAVFPSVLREDPRYYQLGHGGFRHRAKYALSRMIVIPTDSGGRQFNYSEFLGNATAAGIGMAYRAPENRTWANGAATWGEQLGVDALGYELKEFWPDIHRKVFHRHKRKQEPASNLNS